MIKVIKQFKIPWITMYHFNCYNVLLRTGYGLLLLWRLKKQQHTTWQLWFANKHMLCPFHNLIKCH